MRIAVKVFPTHENVDWCNEERGGIEIPNLTEEEVIESGRGIKAKGEAGPDGIPREVIKLMSKSYPKKWQRL